ncbi:MAG TPA: hypothetical protein VFT74_13370, partial [Isosphaeraceae bacterium]|nr:hypothetical protein [Isosphaeraceae bacterium]
MPELYEVFDRLKATCREYEVVLDATEKVQRAVERQGIPGLPETTSRDYESALENLESTYLVRLWAEFESALRS